MSLFSTTHNIPAESSTTILVVEDSQSIRAIYSDYLNSDETLNYRILEAETVEEGLSLWRTEHPDVVLVDFMLPDGDGLALLAAMGKDNRDKRLPAIMLTSEGDERIAVQSMKLGAMDYLSKKYVTAFSLRQSIHNLLNYKQAESILQFQGQILEEIHDAVFSTDILGNINSWNRGAEQLYGYKSAEIIGQNMSLLFNNPMGLNPPDLNSLMKSDRQELEVKTRSQSGEEIDVSLRFSVVRNEQGQVIRLIGCSNDISDRKIAEAQLQANHEQILRSHEELTRANRLKDDFLSRISHELRTPLSSIKVAAQMLEIRLQPLGLMGNDSNSIQRYLSIIQEECQREITLITDLLDLTRSDTGAGPLDLVPIELQQFIPHIVSPFYEQIHLQRQQFTLSIPQNVPTLTTDLSCLGRILQELLQNACRYTPPEEQISLSVQSFIHSVEIRISNSGVEIPRHEQGLIFDKFYRMPNIDPWQHGGTGLGLALVKQLVQQIGGKISLSSGNLNTCFVLDIPWGNLRSISPD